VYPSVFDGTENTQLHYHHNGEGSGTLLIQILPSLVLKLVFGKVSIGKSPVVSGFTPVLG